jgi:hypothetical protein
MLDDGVADAADTYGGYSAGFVCPLYSLLLSRSRHQMRMRCCVSLEVAVLCDVGSYR